jgi:kynurenine formamidase
LSKQEDAVAALRALPGWIDSEVVEVIDLTHVLDDQTPPIRLPPPKASPPRFTLRELSRYDERGEHEYWNAFETGEHVGTHFDAPIHWHTGRDLEDVSAIRPENLIAPAVVFDVSAACAEDRDHLVSADEVKAFAAEIGGLPAGGWLLLRTGADRLYGDERAFLGLDEDDKPHWPGITVECARYLADEAPIIGLGIDAIGTDAAISYGFDPPHPGHHYLHGAGKYGMSLLANLDRLPTVGSLLITAPLRIGGGSGSPVRALALVAPGGGEG